MKRRPLFAILTVALAVAPAWRDRAPAQQEPTRPGSRIPFLIACPDSPLAGTDVGPDDREPFPGRAYTDIVANVDEAPTGRLIFGIGPHVLDTGQRARMDEAPTGHFLWLHQAIEQGFGITPMFHMSCDGLAPAFSPTVNRNPVVPILVDADCATCLDPPGEAEVLDALPKPAPGIKVNRAGFTMLIEKIGSQVDPVKIYPLAGRCQLVHCHYKATVTFDEQAIADGPTPILTKTEVVFLDKDHLRRAPETDPPAANIDARIDRLTREIAELKRSRQADQVQQEKIRQTRQQTLDRLNEQLESLKREIQAAPTPERRPISDRDKARMFSYFIGAFW